MSGADELFQLIKEAKSDDQETRMAACRAAVSIASELVEWPLAKSRDEFKGAMLSLLGVDYIFRERGERAEDIERGIAALELALTFHTREKFPEHWAEHQKTLGLAYEFRLFGNAADHRERAIASCQAALTVFTYETAPKKWAEVHQTLAIKFSNRTQGDPADNIEREIASNEAALRVFTRDAFPKDWAMTQFNLGNAFWRRVQGNRAENIERTITAVEAALSVYSRETDYEKWAHTQNLAAFAYRDRSYGSRSDNIERAIVACEAALTVYKVEVRPWRFAEIHTTLARLYTERIYGNRAENLESAIAASKLALAAIPLEVAPDKWARALYVLGNCYLAQARDNREGALEQAIVAFEEAIVIFTRDSHPDRWGEIQGNLGAAYKLACKRKLWPGRDQQDIFERSIAAFRAALTVIDRVDAPQNWGLLQYNLAGAYLDCSSGDRAEDLKCAIAASEAALTVVTLEVNPRFNLLANQVLGRALSERGGEWDRAYAAYTRAREAFFLIFGEGLDDTTVRELIEWAGTLFRESAYVAAQLGDLQAALRLFNEGRSQLLAIVLNLQTLDLSSEQRVQLETLRSAIRDNSRIMDVANSQDRAAILEKIMKLRRDLRALIDETGGVKGNSRDALALAKSCLSEGGAIIAPIITSLGTKVLIVADGSHDEMLSVVDVPGLTNKRLTEFMGGSQDESEIGWMVSSGIQYLPPVERELLAGEWLAAIDALGPKLWLIIGGALDAELKMRGIAAGARVVWLPSDLLGVLPLALARDGTDGQRFGDTYEITFAPSLNALAAASRQILEPCDRSVAAVINPTGDLTFAEIEGNLVAGYFKTADQKILKRDAASCDAVLAALRGQSYWHFSCHGTFNWDDARLSALVMSGDELLTVGLLAETKNLRRPRLVVLSACETGLYELTNAQDEFTSLPSAFTGLGAAGVLSTLWQVDDGATALLVSKFYDLHLSEGLEPPTALKSAQAWLREATTAELIVYVRSAIAKCPVEDRELMEKFENSIRRGQPRNSSVSSSIQWTNVKSDDTGKHPQGRDGESVRQDRPFAHPYYWGSFIYTGL